MADIIDIDTISEQVPHNKEMPMSTKVSFRKRQLRGTVSNGSEYRASSNSNRAPVMRRKAPRTSLLTINRDKQLSASELDLFDPVENKEPKTDNGSTDGEYIERGFKYSNL
jgi:hypothetical protein